MEEKICKHCGCVLTNEPEYKCYRNPNRTLAEKIMNEDIINSTDWEIGAEETIVNGMLKFHDQLSSQLEPPVKPEIAELHSIVSEEYIDNYIDMGHFREPEKARPYLLDGFTHGYNFLKKKIEKQFSV